MTNEYEVRYDVILLLGNNPIGKGKLLKKDEIAKVISSISTIIEILQDPPELGLKISMYRLYRE